MTPDRDTSTTGFLDDVRGHVTERLPQARVEAEQIVSADVAGSLVNRAQASDLLVIGASRDWILLRTLAGAFADDLANRIDRSLVMLRPHESRPQSLWRQAVGAVRSR